MKLAGGKLTGAPAEVGRIGGREESRPLATEAARKRAAVELISRQEGPLRRTARRFSLCADDADDAYQRALEILLTKAPTDDVRELARWMTTVVKHEALKVRQNRERILGGPETPPREDEQDWVALIPSDRDGPAEQAERHELIARSREALQALKPQELRALTLLAEGYSYAEIGEITGFSHTKINRCVAEGRERFRSLVSRSEDGRRCEELSPLLSAFCDGEASGEDAAAAREHLRACAHCRSTMRAYRAAPRAAAALVPALPVSLTLMERAHEAFASLHSRLPWQGGAGNSFASQVTAAGGTPGAGMVGLAKVLAVCVGTAGGAAACVAAGVVPSPLPLDIGGDHAKRPTIEQHLSRPVEAAVFGVKTGDAVNSDPTSPSPKSDQPVPAHSPAPAPPTLAEVTPEATVPAAPTAPATAPAPISSGAVGSGSSSGSSAGAGEFGP
jgi:RNA polymerase sigma factor (sigma-70 family)